MTERSRIDSSVAEVNDNNLVNCLLFRRNMHISVEVMARAVATLSRQTSREEGASQMFIYIYIVPL